MTRTVFESFGFVRLFGDDIKGDSYEFVHFL